MYHQKTCWEDKHLLATENWAFTIDRQKSLWQIFCSKDGKPSSVTLTLSL